MLLFLSLFSFWERFYGVRNIRNLKKKQNEEIRNAKNFDELLDIKYGRIGTSKRDAFEEQAQYFVISEMLKDARKEAKITQAQLAEKIGTKEFTFHDLKMEDVIYNSSRQSSHWDMLPNNNARKLSYGRYL